MHNLPKHADSGGHTHALLAVGPRIVSLPGFKQDRAVLLRSYIVTDSAEENWVNAHFAICCLYLLPTWLSRPFCNTILIASVHGYKTILAGQDQLQAECMQPVSCPQCLLQLQI